MHDELIITLRSGHRVDVRIDGQVLHAEEPWGDGDEPAVSPFQLFLCAIGTCAGNFVQSFCGARGLDCRGIKIFEHPELDARGTLRSLELKIELPSDFPPQYIAAITRVLEECPVTRALRAQPELRVEAFRKEEER